MESTGESPRDMGDMKIQATALCSILIKILTEDCAKLMVDMDMTVIVIIIEIVYNYMLMKLMRSLQCSSTPCRATLCR